MAPPQPLARLLHQVESLFLGPRREPTRYFWPLLAASLAGIGLADYMTGTYVSLAFFYLVPTLVATARRGLATGVGVAVLASCARLASDLLTRMPPTVPLPPVLWNTLSSLAIALVVVVLLSSLISFRNDLEVRIALRTAELNAALAERARLEQTVLEVGARERNVFGRELHDEIGQHLVATALAAQVLAQSLAGEPAAQAGQIVRWIEEGIGKTRRLARGLLLSEIPPGQFLDELENLAASVTTVGIPCRVLRRLAQVEASPAECAQLHRIAQEATANALRHSGATLINIEVEQVGAQLCLSVSDNGRGLPAGQPGDGLGLHIMSQRAALIGARFSIAPARPRGTVVRVLCAPPGAAYP
jgi:signal transduction histidine kinase